MRVCPIQKKDTLGQYLPTSLLSQSEQVMGVIKIGKQMDLIESKHV